MPAILDPPQVSIRSLHAEAYQEAQKHKWIESQKAGRNVGDAAIEEWYDVHWPVFCREKRIEHIGGDQYWEEFNEEAYGRLHHLIVSGDVLTDRILDRVYYLDENLYLLNWAMDWGLPMDRVIEILELIDVNCARIEPIDPAF